MLDVDIVIIGSGMVGLAAACALSKTPLRVAIVDDKKLTLQLPDVPCLRASAINAFSESYFRRLGIWDRLVASGRVLTFQRVEVREKHSPAFFELDRMDHCYASLGHIIENDLIIKILYEHVRASGQIDHIAGRVESISINDKDIQVHLNNSFSINAKLIIAADGASSFVRRITQTKIWQYSYRHHALIATVRTEKKHGACARQLFYANGIIAFLPLWKEDEHCLVWSVKPNQVERLKNSPIYFNTALTEMSANWLGQCDVQSQIASFPLMARYVPSPVRHRVIFIGDAAHTIHPLAGQGVNLGLRDVADLARCLIQLYYGDKDIGLKPHFLSYQRRRTKEVLTMLIGMQTIESCFDGQLGIKKWARGVGMNFINRVPIIKQHLLKYALGV